MFIWQTHSTIYSIVKDAIDNNLVALFIILYVASSHFAYDFANLIDHQLEQLKNCFIHLIYQFVSNTNLNIFLESI